MKNTAKKVIIIGLGVCLFALLFVLLFLWARPYTEEVIIWLPGNYELENNVKNEPFLMMPNLDVNRQSNPNLAVFYSVVDLDSFKELAGKNEKVLVRIEDASRPGDQKYRIIYQIKYCIDNSKGLIVSANEYYGYNKITLSEMRLRDGTLFLKNNKNTSVMRDLLIAGLTVIVSVAFVCWPD